MIQPDALVSNKESILFCYTKTPRKQSDKETFQFVK